MINGVVAVPIMILMMLMGTSRKVMGDFKLSGWLLVVGWLSTAVMALAAFGLFATWGKMTATSAVHRSASANSRRPNAPDKRSSVGASTP